MNPSLPALPDDDDRHCDPDSQRCLLYLFGELDAEATERFEQSLQRDAELCQRLAEQADIVARLGVTAFAEGSLRRQPLGSAATCSAAERGGSRARLTAFAAILAVAASLLCLVWWLPRAHQPGDVAAEQHRQTQRLADAWLVSYGTAQQPLEQPDTAVAADDEVADLESLAEQPVDAWQAPASPPDWMVAALAGLDAEQHRGTEVSDG